MSLDVYLEIGEDRIEKCKECGGEGKINHGKERVYSANITHNLGEMAGAAGIYEHLWRPEEIGITKAAQLIEPLREGLKKMKDNPAEYEKYNSPNGWGLYKHFVPWIENYLRACEENPEAIVSVWR